MQAPSGTVTFLFTDIEGSTRGWESDPEAMAAALVLHDEILRKAVLANGGFMVKTTGDGLFAAFDTAHDAVTAAVEGQIGLASEAWGPTGPIRVRMGLHTGDAGFVAGDYHGPAVNRAARLTSAARVEGRTVPAPQRRVPGRSRATHRGRPG